MTALDLRKCLNPLTNWGEGAVRPSLLFLCLLLKIWWDNPYLKIIRPSNLFVADVTMKKNGLPPIQSTFIYRFKIRPWARGLNWLDNRDCSIRAQLSSELPSTISIPIPILWPTMVFIIDGGSFHYAHTWSISGILNCWRPLVTSEESSNPIFFLRKKTLFT